MTSLLCLAFFFRAGGLINVTKEYVTPNQLVCNLAVELARIGVNCTFRKSVVAISRGEKKLLALLSPCTQHNLHKVSVPIPGCIFPVRHPEGAFAEC